MDDSLLVEEIGLDDEEKALEEVADELVIPLLEELETTSQLSFNV